MEPAITMPDRAALKAKYLDCFAARARSSQTLLEAIRRLLRMGVARATVSVGCGRGPQPSDRAEPLEPRVLRPRTAPAPGGRRPQGLHRAGTAGARAPAIRQPGFARASRRLPRRKGAGDRRRRAARALGRGARSNSGPTIINNNRKRL